MIRVELLGRQGRSPWPKALLSVLVVCGGLYGIYHFFPALTRPIFSASSALIAAAQQEISPQREVISNPEEAQREAIPSPEEAQREAIPSPEEAISIPVQETAPKPTTQQEVARSATVQQEATPSPEPRDRIKPRGPARSNTPSRSNAVPSPFAPAQHGLPPSHAG